VKEHEDIDRAEFEFDMLTFIHMRDKPYEQAVKAARQEMREGAVEPDWDELAMEAEIDNAVNHGMELG